MKIAWLVWEYEDDDYPILVPEDSVGQYDYACRKVRITYIEIIE